MLGKAESIFNELLNQVKFITTSSSVYSLMQSYEYLTYFVSAYDISNEGYMQVALVFTKNVAPLLLSGQYYKLANETHQKLKALFKKTGSEGDNAREELLKWQIEFSDEIQGEFLMPGESKKIVSPIKNFSIFLQIEKQLVELAEEAYQLKKMDQYYKILKKVIHLELLGCQQTSDKERYQQITEAMLMCCESIAFAVSQSNPLEQKIFEALTSICFAHYFSVFIQTDTDKCKHYQSALTAENVDRRRDLLLRIILSADSIFLQASLLAKDKSQREDFIAPLLERVRCLYEIVVKNIKVSDKNMPFYNYALHAFEKLSQLMFCQRDKNYIQSMTFTFFSDIELMPWKTYRQELKTLREEVKAKLCAYPIGDTLEVVKYFNQQLKSFIKKIFEKSIALTGKPVAFEYALLGLGSLARGEACPYSDLECALLVEEKGLSEENKLHTEIILRLFKLTITSLGELPYFSTHSLLPMGLRLDELYMPLNTTNLLWGTVNQLSSYLTATNVEGDIEGTSAEASILKNV